MSRDRSSQGSPPESVISLIGPGMKVVGDCETDGTLRIEGAVEGTVRAGKAVVIGRDGFVVGDVLTQDAVISGCVTGTVTAESRLELQASCRIDGDVHTPRLLLEEGAVFNGSLAMAATGPNRPDAEPEMPTVGTVAASNPVDPAQAPA